MFFCRSIEEIQLWPQRVERLHHTPRSLKVINVAVGSSTGILLKSSHLRGRDPEDLGASSSNEAATACHVICFSSPLG